MPSAAWPVQQLFYSTMNGDATLMGLITKVYDMAVPETVTPVFPYVVVGEKVETPANRLTGIGREVGIRIHIWSRYRGSKEVDLIASRITDLFEKKHLTLSMSGWLLNSIDLEMVQILEDSVDQQHGIVQFNVRTQPA